MGGALVWGFAEWVCDSIVVVYAGRDEAVCQRVCGIDRAEQGARVGFTLLELLVTIGVIVVLISLMLPALSSIRDRGRVARSLSGHRQILVSLGIFGLSRDGRHPYVYTKRVGSFADPRFEVSESEGDGFAALPMASQARLWGSVVAVGGAFGLKEVLYPPRWELHREQYDEMGLVEGSYVASSTMFARAEYFGADSSRARLSQFGVTRDRQVVYPSSKVMFEDLESWGALPQTAEIRTSAFGFGDGSASVMREDEFTGDWVDRPLAWQVGPGHTTLDGLSGRDR
jgi:hypothetical protein